MSSPLWRFSRRRAVVLLLLAAIAALVVLPMSGALAQVTRLQYYVTATTRGAGGYCNPSAAIVDRNDAFSTDIVPDDHVKIVKITDNGVDMPIANPYVIPCIYESHIVVVTFTDQLTVNASLEVGSSLPVIAERSMYWNSRGAGTSTVGAWAH